MTMTSDHTQDNSETLSRFDQAIRALPEPPAFRNTSVVLLSLGAAFGAWLIEYGFAPADWFIWGCIGLAVIAQIERDL